MKVKISRSFDKKLQLRQFEPASWFCSAEMEVELEDAEEMSAKLDLFCQNEVAKAKNLFEVMKPIPKFDFKVDYNKLFEPKHRDQAQDSAERDTEQYVGKGEKSFEID